MSEAWMPFQPAIDEPSNACPLSNLSFVNCLLGTENVLFLAAGIGKPQVNELHIVFFDCFKYVVGNRHIALLSWEVGARIFGEAQCVQEPCPAKKSDKSLVHNELELSSGVVVHQIKA